MSFLEGFGKSLGAYFTNRAVESEREERDRKGWEWKARKAQELEDEFSKKRVVNVEIFQQGDGYMAQPVNAAGEPVGAPRPATPAEVDRRRIAQEDRDLDVKGKKAQIGRDEAAARASSVSAELAPKELEIRRGESAARTEQARASAAESRARAEGQGIMNEFYKRGEAPPGKEGPGGGAGGLESKDVETLRKTVGELGLDPADEMVAQIIQRSSSVQQAEVALRMYAREAQQNTAPGGLSSRDIGSLNFRLTPNQ